MRSRKGKRSLSSIQCYAPECVGFHDYEACAAVCPVDCCVTDPDNIETEEALIERARALHPDTRFDDNFESRFRKGQGKSAAGGAKNDLPARAASAAGNTGTEVTSPAMPASNAAASSYAEPEVNFVPLPDIDSWDIPVRCFKCNQPHVEPVRNFMIGNVIFCPHSQQVHGGARQFELPCPNPAEGFLRQMAKRKTEFQTKRERELAEFVEGRAKEAEAFEAQQQRELQKIRQQLDAMGETYDAPGKPIKKDRVSDGAEPFFSCSTPGFTFIALAVYLGTIIGLWIMLLPATSTLENSKDKIQFSPAPLNFTTRYKLVL